MMNNTRLIKITEEHYLLVDNDSIPQKGDWVYHDRSFKIFQADQNNISGYKIIFSSKPLENYV